MTFKTIITVDGIDGSGKSTFARRLLPALAERGAAGVIVSVDDFRRPVDWSRAQPSEAEVYYDGYYDLALAETCLRAFSTGGPGMAIPVFDSAAERMNGAKSLVFEGASVAIVEGVFPLRLPAVQDGLLIYLDASPALARRRIIERDLAKGRSREEIERRIDRRYSPGQQRYRSTLSPRDRADVVIDNEVPTSPRALKRDLSRLPEPLRAILDHLLPA